MCAKETNVHAVKAICVELKYLDGLLINVDEGNACEEYGGEDHCGYKPTKVHYMAMKCEPDAEKVMDCYRELADGCGHEQDVIVDCVLTDYAKPIEPDQWTIRMLDAEGSAS